MKRTVRIADLDFDPEELLRSEPEYAGFLRRPDRPSQPTELPTSTVRGTMPTLGGPTPGRRIRDLLILAVGCLAAWTVVVLMALGWLRW